MFISGISKNCDQVFSLGFNSIKNFHGRILTSLINLSNEKRKIGAIAVVVTIISLVIIATVAIFANALKLKKAHNLNKVNRSNLQPLSIHQTNAFSFPSMLPSLTKLPFLSQTMSSSSSIQVPLFVIQPFVVQPLNITLPNIPTLLVNSAQFVLPVVQQPASLNLSIDKTGPQLTARFSEAIHQAKFFEKELKLKYPQASGFRAHVSLDALSNQIKNAVDHFLQGNTLTFEKLATQLDEHLDELYLFYESTKNRPLHLYLQNQKSLYGKFKLNSNPFYFRRKILKKTPNSLTKSYIKACKQLENNFTVLCEQKCNTGEFIACLNFSNFIYSDYQLKDKISLHASNHLIFQGNVNNILIGIKGCRILNHGSEFLKLYMAKTYFNNGNLKDAHDIVNQMSSLDDKTNEIKLAIAITHFNAGNLKDAYAIVNQMSSLKDKANEIKLAIAITHFIAGNLKDAYDIVNQMSSLNDKANEIKTSIAKTHFNASNLKDAYDIVNQMSSLNDKANEIKTAIAKTHFNASDLKEAYNLVNGLTGNDAEDVRLAIAKTYFNTGNFDQAEDIAESLVQKKQTEIIEAIVLHYYHKDDIKQLLKTIKKTPTVRTQICVNIVFAYLQQGSLDEALLVAEEMPFGNEQDAALADIALAHYRLKQSQKAISIAERMSDGVIRDEFIRQMKAGKNI